MHKLVNLCVSFVFFSKPTSLLVVVNDFVEQLPIVGEISAVFTPCLEVETTIRGIAVDADKRVGVCRQRTLR